MYGIPEEHGETVHQGVRRPAVVNPWPTTAVHTRGFGVRVC